VFSHLFEDEPEWRAAAKLLARQAHQMASLGDGETTMGPVMTDVIALLGRGAFFSAPFRNSISSACLPTFRPVI
jgi:hypothetical protein